MKILLLLPAAASVRVRVPGEVPRREMLRFSVLPLTTVAALTPLEHEVRICDENVEPVDLDCDANVVGISFMTALAPRAYELAEEFRRRGKIVVAGGYHPTLCTGEVAEHFDAVVVGEAEGLWPEVLKDVQNGSLKRIYRHESPVEPSQMRIPRRDLLYANRRRYATINAVQTARGCVHACRYCSIAAFHGGHYRHREVSSVIEELRTLPRNFMFVDDNILADAAYARELFTAMLPMNKRWISQCSLKIADDPELLRLARAAGCRGLFIGIETLSSENLASVGKQFNNAQEYRRKIALIRQCGIGVQAGIIVGMDGDGPGVFERTLRFLQECSIDAIQLNILTPLPGTPLYEQYERAGRIVDRDWSHYDFRHTVIRPLGMTRKELQDGADWLYAQYYRLDRIVLRTLKAAWRLGPIGAALVWKLNTTYRYDNLREGIRGRNPAAARAKRHPNHPVAWTQRSAATLLGLLAASVSCASLHAEEIPTTANATTTQANPGSRAVGSVLGKVITAGDIGLTGAVDPAMQFDSRNTELWELRGRIVRAFGTPLLERFVEQQKIEPTAEEIAAFRKTMHRGAQRQVREWEAKVDKVKKDLESQDLSADARRELEKSQTTDEQTLAALRDTAKAEAPESMARAFIVSWKIERELHRRYGGRVIFQQFGPEALDARRSLYEEAEKRGELSLTDPGVRHMFYYYSNMKHTVMDAAALETPWFLKREESE